MSTISCVRAAALNESLSHQPTLIFSQKYKNNYIVGSGSAKREMYS